MEAQNLDTKKYLYHLELDREVETYEQGGNKVVLPNQDRFISFTPHFIVTRRDKKQVVFIDRKLELTDHIISKLSTAYRNQQKEFVRVLPSQIHLQPYLENAEFLYRYAWEPVTLEHKFAVFEFFQKRRATTIEDFQLFLQSRNLSRSSVFSLIFKNWLKVDMHRKLSENSVLLAGEIQEISI